MLLKDKVVVVTGAAQGIGLAIAQACARDGAIVELVDRSGDELAKVTKSMAVDGYRVHANVCDLANEEAVDSLFAGVESRRGVIDGLVNNAGTTVYGGSMDTTLSELHRILDIHLAPTLLCAQQAAKRMLPRRQGSIVNMASAAASVAVTRFFGYSMAKAAIISMTKHMATEFGSHGITVNALAPGPVLTETLKKNQNAAVMKALTDDIPAERFAEPAEIAGAALFLLSGLASYVNGHVLTVDGGLTIASTRLDRIQPS